MTRVLILCTHNSARSQMAEGLVRQLAAACGLPLEVWSAGTGATRVKEEARQVMGEIGIDLSGHFSKAVQDVPDPWTFDYVVTVCDSAAESCPAYPERPPCATTPSWTPAAAAWSAGGRSVTSWRGSSPASCRP